MLTNNEIKQIFYLLEAKFYHTHIWEQSAAILNYKKDLGIMLWYHLHNDTVMISKGVETYYDREKFCEILIKKALEAFAEKPYLTGWLGETFKTKLNIKGDEQCNTKTLLPTKIWTH